MKPVYYIIIVCFTLILNLVFIANSDPLKINEATESAVILQQKSIPVKAPIINQRIKTEHKRQSLQAPELSKATSDEDEVQSLMESNDNKSIPPKQGTRL